MLYIISCVLVLLIIIGQIVRQENIAKKKQKHKKPTIAKNT